MALKPESQALSNKMMNMPSNFLKILIVRVSFENFLECETMPELTRARAIAILLIVGLGEKPFSNSAKVTCFKALKRRDVLFFSFHCT